MYIYIYIHNASHRLEAHKLCVEAGLPSAWHLTVVASLLSSALKTLDGVEIFAGCKALTIRCFLYSCLVQAHNAHPYRFRCNINVSKKKHSSVAFKLACHSKQWS